MISRGLSNKVVGNMVETNVSHNATISAADCYPILPEIATEAGGAISTQARQTDRIKPKSLYVRGAISLKYVGGTSPPTSLPIYVRIMILSQKDIKNTGTLVPRNVVDADHMLHPALDAADTTQFQGTLSDLQYPVNRNKFRVYMDKIVQLHACDISNSFGGDNPAFAKRFKYTFKNLPSVLTFDEGSGNYVNNFAPFIAIGWCNSDGTANPGITIVPVNANIYSQLTFEDA